ncbi:MAG: hypothetical protein D6797_02685 [Bdellovibrio sp.]|nr:MAG: hypothetical protein D6797_02685 [Bdellovibrio sp.]
MKTWIYLISTFSVFILFQNCAKHENGADLSLLSQAQIRDELTKATQNILDAKCASCHFSATTENTKLKNMDLSSLIGAKLITPGDPQNSPLVFKIVNKYQLQDPPLLSNEEFNTIRDYILFLDPNYQGNDLITPPTN